MKTVIIIGAGPAGLTAGYELRRQSPDTEVLLLEESDTVGGISRTVRYHGNRMDIGGHRFFSKDDEVNAWWQAMLPLQGSPAYDDKALGRTATAAPGGPDPDTADDVMLARRRVSRIYYRRKFFDYPIRMSAATIRNMGFGTTMQAGFSYLKTLFVKKPEDSLENFYINRFGRKLYSMFFEGYTEKLWGRHPREISADWGAQRVKGLSIAAILRDIFSRLVPGRRSAKNVETSLIEEFHYPKYGPGQMWETVAARFAAEGGTLKTGCRVTAVCTEGAHVTGVRYISGGQEYFAPADAVISSMPLKDLAAGMSGVPDDVGRIAAGLPYRDFVTVGLLLRRLQLKNTTGIPTLGNIVPDCWIYVQDTGVKLGRIQIFNNWSPYLVADPDRTVWIGLEYFCTEGDRWWNMTPEQWKDFGAQELVRMGVIGDAAEVLDFHCEKVKKAYPAYFDTYDRIDTLIGWLNGFDNLYCVGRNGQHRYNNMDHSMATAFEAVRALLHGGDKTALWRVNTEQSYHEEKTAQ